MNPTSFLPNALVVVGVMLIAANSQAAGDLTSQEPVEIKVQLGDANDALQFFPETLKLETGKLYRLILSNPSPQKHYFSSEKLAGSVFTRKVQVNNLDGKPTAEVKGHVREIEVYPNGTAEWWFVPIKAGEIGDLKCTISGHAEAGMVGSVTIE